MNRDLDRELPSAGSSEEPPWIVAGICMNRRDPADAGRVLRTEVDPDDVRQWHELARHLVQGHGGEPNGLISNKLTLDQLRFAHADTHLALSFISTGPPDGHAHPGPLDAGEPTGRLASYFPFWSSPSSAAEDARDSVWFPAPTQTGLPHTGIYHVSFAELEEWAAGRLPRRLTSPTAEDDAMWAYWAEKLSVTEATRAEWIKAHADRASAAWLARNRASAAGLARTSFPDQMQAGRPVPPASRARQNPPYHTRGRRL
ncbi:MAG TPA: hypothetical protein VKU77_10035 [Streptosporangiaceae bacterium]|nr:hypothetical protein [Streptosporangiaceae bacterium]